MSSASSRASSPDEAIVSADEASARLQHLERLIQASLGYSINTAVGEEDEADRPLKKKKKKAKGLPPSLELVGGPSRVEVDEEEVVGAPLLNDTRWEGGGGSFQS